jgi:hypothetical protein
MCSPREALYIVNSLHHSTFPRSHLDSLRPLEQEGDDSHSPSARIIPVEPIDFGQFVSPRLAAHSFLHLLIRQGLPDKASKYAELMMQQGIRIHKGTTEAIVRSLCNSGPLAKLKNTLPFTSRIAEIPAHTGHSGILAAENILSCARRFGQERTERMYRNLIDACIMQGEIIIASLLFVLLVKDWQVYKARQEAKGQNQLTMEAANSDQSLGDVEAYSSGQTPQVYSRSDVSSTIRNTNRLGSHLLNKPPYPEQNLLTMITNDIHTAFARDLDDPGGDERLKVSLQALANIVSFIDSGQIHSSHISSLITLMYKCPRTDYTVQIKRGGREFSVKAYSYFHDFLRRLAASLVPSRVQAPLLDTRSCNSLLHYALRHRMSPQMATKVLDHMCTRSLPNTTTVNILLRSGTLLRRMDISQAALAILQQSSDMGGLLLDQLATDKTVTSKTSVTRVVGKNRNFERALKQLQRQKLQTPAITSSRSSILPADVYTLVAYISYLTSIGRPDTITEMVFKILPELGRVEPSIWAELSPVQRDIRREELQQACIRKAVQLGPHFFATLLNALVKAGKTGLAERMWDLAQQAERASWTSEYASIAKPWLLSIHAYTSMIQCYAAEARRSPVRWKAVGGDIEALHRNKKLPVRGWARYIHKKQQLQQDTLPRHQAGRAMAALLFQTTLSGGRQVISSLFEVRNDKEKVAQIQAAAPVPDARFFNAVLRLFRPLSSYPSRPKRSPAAYRRLFDWSMRAFVERRVMSRRCTPLLLDVGEAMIAARYPIPLAYRHLLVGRLPQATRDIEPPPNNAISPYNFPRQKMKRCGPRRLPTRKTRGLPIRRVRRETRSD